MADTSKTKNTSQTIHTNDNEDSQSCDRNVACETSEAPTEILSREKRSKGILMSILEFWLGSDDDNIDGTRAINIVAHEAKAVRHLAQELDQRQSNLKKTMQEIEGVVQVELKKTFAKINIDKVNLMMLKSELHISQFINHIQAFYDKILQHAESADVVEEIIEQNPDISGNKKLYPQYRKELTTTKIKQDKYGYIIVLINVPIYWNNVMHKIHVFPVPANEIMPDVQESTIFMEENQEFYATHLSDLIQLDDDVFVCNSASNIFKKVASSTDCVIKNIVNPGYESCPMKRVPEGFEMWTKTSSENTFFFYSESKKFLSCPAGRKQLQQTSGAIKIPQGCWVETADKIIRGNDNKAGIVKKMASLEFNDDYKIDEVTTVKVEFTPIEELHEIDTSDIEDVKRETDEYVVYVWETYWKTIMFWAAIVFGLVGLALMWCWCKYQPRWFSSRTNPARPTETATRSSFKVTKPVRFTYPAEIIELDELTIDTNPLKSTITTRVPSGGEDVRSHDDRTLSPTERGE